MSKLTSIESMVVDVNTSVKDIAGEITELSILYFDLYKKVRLDPIPALAEDGAEAAALAALISPLPADDLPMVPPVSPVNLFDATTGHPASPNESIEYVRVENLQDDPLPAPVQATSDPVVDQEKEAKEAEMTTAEEIERSFGIPRKGTFDGFAWDPVLCVYKTRGFFTVSRGLQQDIWKKISQIAGADCY